MDKLKSAFWAGKFYQLAAADLDTYSYSHGDKNDELLVSIEHNLRVAIKHADNADLDPQIDNEINLLDLYKTYKPLCDAYQIKIESSKIPLDDEI